MNGPLDHPSVEAKGEGDFVLRANLAGQRNDLAFRALSTATVRTGRASEIGGVVLSQPATVAAIRAAAAIRDLNIGAAFRRNAKVRFRLQELAGRVLRRTSRLNLALHSAVY